MYSQVEERGIRKREEGLRTCGMSVRRKRRFTRNAATATHAVAETKPNQRLMYYTYWGNLRQVSAVELGIPRVLEVDLFHSRRESPSLSLSLSVSLFPSLKNNSEGKSRIRPGKSRGNDKNLLQTLANFKFNECRRSIIDSPGVY